MKLVFFDFDVRSSDKCAEADFIEVKTGGRVFNESTNSNNSKKRMDIAGHFLLPSTAPTGWSASLNY